MSFSVGQMLRLILSYNLSDQLSTNEARKWKEEES